MDFEFVTPILSPTGGILVSNLCLKLHSEMVDMGANMISTTDLSDLADYLASVQTEPGSLEETAHLEASRLFRNLSLELKFRDLNFFMITSLFQLGQSLRQTFNEEH